MKKPFISPISRLFPKKIVNYLLIEINKILENHEKQNNLSDIEFQLITKYKNDLLNNKIYYDKANLDFVRAIYPNIIANKVNQDVQFLYSEILRINPSLLTNRIGNELFFDKLRK